MTKKIKNLKEDAPGGAISSVDAAGPLPSDLPGGASNAKWSLSARNTVPAAKKGKKKMKKIKVQTRIPESKTTLFNRTYKTLMEGLIPGFNPSVDLKNKKEDQEVDAKANGEKTSDEVNTNNIKKNSFADKSSKAITKTPLKIVLKELQIKLKAMSVEDLKKIAKQVGLKSDIITKVSADKNDKALVNLISNHLGEDVQKWHIIFDEDWNLKK